jgi:predicted ATPase
MISEIRLVNYMKFLNEKIPLSPITIFIGPNGSGKSTVASALYKLSTIVRLGIKAAFPEGFFTFKNIINYDAENFGYSFPPIGLGISGTLGDMTFDYDIFFNKNMNSPSGFYVNYERLYIKDKNYKCDYHNGKSPSINSYSNNVEDLFSWPEGLPIIPQRDSIFVEALRKPTQVQFVDHLYKIRKYLQLMSRYQFSASVTRMGTDQYDGSGRQPILKQDGANLAEVVQFLQEEQRGLLGEMRDWIVKYAEGGTRIVDIFVATDADKVFLNFFEEGKAKRTFEVRGPLLSDGYWIFSAFACLASCVSLPSIAFFEEPEAHLHPHKLGILYDVLNSMTKRESNPCQVLISSHSPYFLDYFKNNPESVVFLNNGKARPLKEIENYNNILAQSTLGESWFANVFLWGNP